MFLASAGIAGAFDMPIIPMRQPADFRQSKRRRTGVKYPHSSTRQHARYARQVAAGQIKFIDHGSRVA